MFNIARDSELTISSEYDMAKLIHLFIQTGGRLFKGHKAKRPSDARIIYYEVDRETYWCHPRDFFLVRISMLDESYKKVNRVSDFNVLSFNTQPCSFILLMLL